MAELLTLLPSAAALALLLGCALAWAGMRDVPDLPARPDDGSRSRIRAVIASRNGGSEIVETVRRLLTCRLEGLEVVVVDDRSTDGSSSELDREFGTDPRFERRRVDQLPEGWLGKPHACSTGAQDFAGDWLLFLDADTWFEPNGVERMVAEAESIDADHLCLLPSLRDTTTAGRAFCSAMALGLLIRIRGLERDCNPRGFGVGACTLIRREVYRGIGGHEAQKLQIVEDVAIARRAVQSGARSRLRFGTGVVSVQWITTARSAFTILDKNWFGAFGFRWHLLVPAVLVGLGLQGLILFGLFSQDLRVVGLCIAAVLAFASVGARHAKRYRWPAWSGLLAPLFWLLVSATMLWSAVRTQARGGVRWRDTFTPLDQLRTAGPP